MLFVTRGDVELFVEPTGSGWEVIFRRGAIELRSPQLQHEFDATHMAREIAASLRVA